MTARKAVRIDLEQLIELLAHPADQFFTDWRCRLCRHRTGALDRESALSAAAEHLQTTHHAHGGHRRRPHNPRRPR